MTHLLAFVRARALGCLSPGHAIVKYVVKRRNTVVLVKTNRLQSANHRENTSQAHEYV